MTSSIQFLWDEFMMLQDRLWRDMEDPQTQAESCAAVLDLADRAEQVKGQTEDEQRTLMCWRATFFRLCAELQVDLGRLDEAIVFFRTSLIHDDDQEVRVGLIAALQQHNLTGELCQEINALSEYEGTFCSTGDAESAAKVLRVLCNAPDVVQHISEAVLKDIVQAVSRRGLVSMQLNSG